MYKYTASSNKGVFEWLMQRISGIILMIVIAIHFFSMLKSGDWGLKTIVVGPLFVFGIFHTLNGFKMITDDYVSSPGWRAIIYGIYWIVGIALSIIALSIVTSS